MGRSHCRGDHQGRWLRMMPAAPVARIEKIYQDIKMVAKHGGFRKGAGRPKGSRNRATIARDRQDRPWIQEEIADSGGIATVSAPGPVRSAERYCSCSAQLWLCLYENSAGHEKANRPLVAGTMTAPSASVGDHPLPYAPQAVSPPAATVTYMLSAVSGSAWLFYNALESFPEFISQKVRPLLIR